MGIREAMNTGSLHRGHDVVKDHGVNSQCQQGEHKHNNARDRGDSAHGLPRRGWLVWGRPGAHPARLPRTWQIHTSSGGSADGTKRWQVSRRVTSCR
jgi:hypothetical protein